jgi:uncharacterized Fe-S cluster-containing radical SAM superfamily protein
MRLRMDCDAGAHVLRQKILNLPRREVLISRISGSEQEQDLRVPPNCGGVGRIRHFKRVTDSGWTPDPLPNDPACRALGLASQDLTHAQVFQTAGCNFRCWFCYVPPTLLAGNRRHAEWLGAGQLLDRYAREEFRPRVIDLSGGEVSLTPELLVWLMKALRERQLDQSTYLWSDDNLSNDFFWRFLSEEDRHVVSTFKNFGKVGCFKGYSADSFSFNTRTPSAFFDRQFEVMSRWLRTGVDLYAYCILTAPDCTQVAEQMPRFVDALQRLNKNLPLRTVPLRVVEFSPMKRLLDPTRMAALRCQWRALEAWRTEIDRRFTAEERMRNIADVPL